MAVSRKISVKYNTSAGSMVNRANGVLFNSQKRAELKTIFKGIVFGVSG